MRHISEQELKAYESAVTLEKEGHKFFTDSAEKSQDRLGREVFEFLAKEELKHIESIEAFRKSRREGRSFAMEAVISKSRAETLHSGIEEIFRELEKEMKPTAADLEVYQLGMNFEARGVSFYKKVKEEATDLRAKELFAFLVGEEQKHYKILEDCYNYMENPAEFFHRREGWHVEG
jgi:rubrerythrin